MNPYPPKRIVQQRQGQAMVELVFVLFFLVIMTFGLIDFGRFIYQRQVLVNVTREASNLASRGLDLTNTMAAAMTSAYPMNLSSRGRVILTQVTNNNGINRITGQLTQGSASGTSRIGSGVGNIATMPATATPVPQPTQSVYVTEVFYIYTPITPIGRLINVVLPTRVYDVAYF